MHAHVQRVQQVMSAVMKPDTHYGKIPGTGDKPTLLKPGAEVLCLTFHIAPSYRTVDLSVVDRDGEMSVARYRVTCTGTHQGSSIALGEGVGECSSNEAKYKWRKAVNNDEFENTPIDRRRIKFGANYNQQQVRTDAADIANTVLKMASKRALIAMVLNVTAASDMFTQDLDDPDASYDDERPQRQTKPRAAEPRTRSNVTGKASDKQVALLALKIGQKDGLEESEFLAHFQLGALAEITFDRVNEALDFIKNWQPAEASA